MKFCLNNLSITIFLIGFISFAQQNQWTLNKNETLQKEVYNSFFETKESLYANLKDQHSRKIRKLMIEELDEFYDEFDKQFDDEKFVFDKRFYDYTNNVFQKIIAANPEIVNAKGLLISKETTLNAYSLPNGFIVVHIGLFYWLENQDQMASIIAHELGHNVFNHSLNHRAEMLIEENSKASKKKLRKIKRSRKGKSIKAREAFKSSLYATSKYKRENEFQADSIGYHFIENTVFDKNQIISSMELSSMYDSLQPVGLNAKTYVQLFDLKKQTFKEEWLEIEDLSNYNYDLLKSRFLKDSIASHPDMEVRIENLIQQFPNLERNTNLKAETDFIELKKLAKMHRVVSLFEDELYSHSLYECLYRIQNEDEIKYYTYWLGENLNQLYHSRRDYTFNKHVSRINPKNQSNSYMQFLSFLWNLSTPELETIAEHYNNTKD